MEKSVDSRFYLANVRSSPSFGDNVIGSVHQGDKVTIIGDQVGDRWLPARGLVNGRNKSYFISKNVLRDRVSERKERLMSECVAQWLRFDREQGKEEVSPYFRFVGEYWRSIGMPLDGKDQDVPWSAAFISYCVRTAGGYTGFKFAAAHARYVHQAVTRRENLQPGPFWGFRLNEHKPQLGDMVCRSRNGSGITYDFAATRDAFQSHCDIIIRVTDSHVSTIGGNVSNTVSRVTYPLNSRGFLASSNGVYAVLRNNL